MHSGFLSSLKYVQQQDIHNKIWSFTHMWKWNWYLSIGRKRASPPIKSCSSDVGSLFCSNRHPIPSLAVGSGSELIDQSCHVKAAFVIWQVGNVKGIIRKFKGNVVASSLAKCPLSCCQWSMAPIHTWPLVILGIAFTVSLEVKYINICLSRQFGQARAFQWHTAPGLRPGSLQNPAPWSGRQPLHPGINAGHLCGRRESLASTNESCCLHVQYI